MRRYGAPRVSDINRSFITSSGNLKGSQIVYGTASNLYQYGALPSNPNLITSFNSANLPTATGVSLSKITGLPTCIISSLTASSSMPSTDGQRVPWNPTYQGNCTAVIPSNGNCAQAGIWEALAGVSFELGEDDAALREIERAKSMAIGDYNNDGASDVLVAINDGAPLLCC